MDQSVKVAPHKFSTSGITGRAGFLTKEEAVTYARDILAQGSRHGNNGDNYINIYEHIATVRYPPLETEVIDLQKTCTVQEIKTP